MSSVETYSPVIFTLVRCTPKIGQQIPDSKGSELTSQLAKEDGEKMARETKAMNEET